MTLQCGGMQLTGIVKQPFFTPHVANVNWLVTTTTDNEKST
jgi:hypothetical protein